MNSSAKKTLSRITTQGQVSVPAAVRTRLGLGPGSTLEWEIDGDHAVVRRAGKYSFADIHQALFPVAPEPKSLDELKEGVRRHIVEKHGVGKHGRR